MKNKKILAKFIGIMLACGAGGAVVGYGVTRMRREIYSTVERATQWFGNNILPISIVIFAVCVFVILYFLSKGKRLMKQCGGDENEISAKADTAMSMALGATSVSNIILFALVGIKFSSVQTNMEGEVDGILTFLVFFIVTMFFCGMMQGHIVNFLKKMNPHMRGNILDTKFQKDWHDSMDEAEKFITYEASYRAHLRMQQTFPAAMGIVMVITLVFGGGSLAILVVGVLWAVQTVTYLSETIRLTSKGTTSSTEKC